MLIWIIEILVHFLGYFQAYIDIPFKSLIYTSFDIFILFLWLSIYLVLKKVIILNKKFETTL
jgi:hypothetical protein